MSPIRLSIRPHFSKQNKFQAKTMFAIGETVALAEWIIDNTCLVFDVIGALSHLIKLQQKLAKTMITSRRDCGSASWINLVI